MRTARRTTRSRHTANLACTASALVALIAVAAAVSSLSPATIRSAMMETRGSNTESAAVRAVAAAVAAVARDLVGGERITAAIPVQALVLEVSSGSIPAAIPSTPGGVRSRLLEERLIDMPPPMC
jgi:hypothetical protein